jgi:hypothetical protein
VTSELSADLTIRIKKHADGRASLTLTRADGTTTWQRQDGAQARFFPMHDLTHYAVETVLGHRRGFYGLVAEGWDLGDFGAPWPRGRLPEDMDQSELIVGFLDMERASGIQYSATEFNEKAASYCAEHGIQNVPAVTEEQLAAIRARMQQLFAEWRRTAPGGTLELGF